MTRLGLTPEEVQGLRAPFPADVLDVYQGFTYIPVEHVTQRLNEVFNFDWDFTAVTTVGEKENRKSKNGSEYVVTPVFADVTITVRSATGAVITRFGSGGGVIGYGKSEGDGHKSAVSDALKKAAQSLEIGLSIAIDAKKAKKAKRGGWKGNSGQTSTMPPPNVGPAPSNGSVSNNQAGGFRPPPAFNR